MDKLTYIANAQRAKVRKPILYWQAIQCGNVIDSNNSIALLRHKYGNGLIYKAVR